MGSGKHNNSKHNSSIIRFRDKGFRLSIDSLKKQVGAETVNHKDWIWPALKFLSFRNGVLTLLNTSEKRSHKLVLQVQENNLLVSCSCGNSKSNVCEHAYAGLYVIIWYLGERYFEKLQSGGLMTMTFSHRKYFDKKESTAGLDVAARPEQQSIYLLAPKIEKLGIPAILKLPGAAVKKELVLTQGSQEIIVHNEETIAYLLIISSRNKLLPALMPCVGKLNKQGTEVKSYLEFLSGAQKKFSHLLNYQQKGLNSACYGLWKIVEKQPGHIIQENPEKNSEKNLFAIFNAWQEIIPLLQRQPFVYSYYLHGLIELRRAPRKRRIRKITVSADEPEIRFVLKDKGVFYQLEMQVWVNDKLLSEPDTGTTLFIVHQKILYMISSIRDAAMVEWIHRSGGWITVFKEHYEAFESEILDPLRRIYKVDMILSCRKTMKNK